MHSRAALFAHFSWLEYGLEILALAVASWVLRKLVMGWLGRRARAGKHAVNNHLVAMLGRVVTVVLVLGVSAASLNLFPLPARLLAVANRILFLAVLTLALYYGAKAVQLLVRYWLSRAGAHESLLEPAGFLTRVVFGALGTAIVLDNLGVSLTAVWTTLGVGSVAVALALQDTLSNFFAGVYIRVDSPVRVGDYIKLDNGQEGFVTSLGWRSTRVRTLQNNVVVVPNSKLASAVITNYSLPEPQMALLIPVGVSCDSDPEDVERILVDEATQAAGQIEGLLADPAPFVRLIPGFGESSLNFTLICRVGRYVDQYLVQHELRKRILARFRREGIKMPFPQHDVHLYAHEGADLANGKPQEAFQDRS